MWTWRRKEPSSPSEPATAPATLPVTRAEWRSLPPIQRAVAEHPLINPVQRFSSSLTSWQSPAYLEPLGHRVGPDEPAGVIGDLARPRTAETRVPDMPVVQRAARKRRVLSRLWEVSAQRAAEPDTPVFESPAPEPESAPQDETVLQPPGELALDEPAPRSVFVLPSVAAGSRETDRPSMPLTSADPSVVPPSPPVRMVQAIRPETPVLPAHPRNPAVEPSPVDTPTSVELPLVNTSTPDHGPSVPTPGPVASEPDLADAPSFEAEPFEAEPFEAVPVGTAPSETVPVQTLPFPAQPPVVEPAASEKTPHPGEPARPALPVVQRTDQTGASPRRLGLGAPILPDSGGVRTPVSPPAEPAATEPEAPVPAAEDSVAEMDAPLTGAVETTVLSAPPAEETAPVADDVPRPVARIAEGEEQVPPAASAETPTLGTAASVSQTPQASETSQTSAATAVQRSSIEPALETPPNRQNVPSSGASVFKPVQRLRDESPLPGPAGVGSPGTLGNVPAADAPITVSRAVTPQPSLPTVPSSRSSPVNTFNPIEVPEIRYNTTETAEPPGTPGGSVSASPAPERTALTPPLPVARAVEDAAAASPVPAAMRLPSATIPASRPTLTAQADRSSGEGARAQLPALTVSRLIEARQSASPLPSVRVLDGSAPPKIQRAHEPSPVVAEPLATKTVPLTPAAHQEDGGVAHPLMAALPVSRIADHPDPAPHLLMPRNGTPMSTERTEPLPVARIAEATPPVQNGRPSTMDVFPAVQRSASSENVGHGNDFVLSLPPVVVSRQAEPPVVQPEPEAAPPPAPVAPPAAQPEPAAASAPPVPAAQPETEELVKKLFDPLLRRLKTELRLDRERRGALTDRPH